MCLLYDITQIFCFVQKGEHRLEYGCSLIVLQTLRVGGMGSVECGEESGCDESRVEGGKRPGEW